MEWILLCILIGWVSDKVFGVSEKERRWREWKKHNPNYIDVLRSD